MNKVQLETFIRLIKERSQNPRIAHLCEAFEAFMSLYASRNQERSDPQAFEKKMAASYRTMWESFYAAADSYGIEGQQFLKHMANPAHLTAEGMQSINSLRQSFEAIEGPVPACSNKKKSRNKNVRI